VRLLLDTHSIYWYTTGEIELMSVRDIGRLIGERLTRRLQDN
jgi:hypothetical protein